MSLLVGFHLLPRSSRLFLSFWWLVCIVTISVYSGNLVAQLSVSKPPNFVDTIDELMEHPEITVGVLANTAYEEYFRVITNSFK